MLRSLRLQCHKKFKRYAQFKQNFNLQLKPPTISACESSQHRAGHIIMKMKYLQLN
jgi:hypothetical protein